MKTIFPTPTNWKELQEFVCILFNQIGLSAKTEKVIKTPRGNIEIDVFAIDTNSADRIRYAVECKNWNYPVNQSIVHAFTSVMHETGCDIGYIISKSGFQSGAKDFARFTNIRLETFESLQRRYIELWLKKCAGPRLRDANWNCNNYCEPCNEYRDREYTKLSPEKQGEFLKIYHQYGNLIQLIEIVDNYFCYRDLFDTQQNPPLALWRDLLKALSDIGLYSKGISLWQLLQSLEKFLPSLESKFKDFFITS